MIRNYGCGIEKIQIQQKKNWYIQKEQIEHTLFNDKSKLFLKDIKFLSLKNTEKKKIKCTKSKFKTPVQKTQLRMKRQSMEWDKIFVNHISKKELISRVYKETQQEENQTTELKSKT